MFVHEANDPMRSWDRVEGARGAIHDAYRTASDGYDDGINSGCDYDDMFKESMRRSKTQERAARSQGASEYVHPSQDDSGRVLARDHEEGMSGTRSDTRTDGNNIPEVGAHALTTNGLMTPEQYMYLGEVLYILRPAIYAWTMHYVGSITTRENTPASPAAATASSTSEDTYESDDDDFDTPAGTSRLSAPIPSTKPIVKNGATIYCHTLKMPSELLRFCTE